MPAHITVFTPPSATHITVPVPGGRPRLPSPAPAAHAGCVCGILAVPLLPSSYADLIFCNNIAHLTVATVHEGVHHCTVVMHVSVLYVGQTWVAQRQSRKRLNFTCACSSWTSVSTARPTLSDPQRNAGRLTCHCLQQVQGSVEAAPQQPFPDAKAAGALEPVPSAQTLIPSSVSASQSPFPPPPDIGGVEPRSRWNAASLAFLGDSLWEVSNTDSGDQ